MSIYIATLVAARDPVAFGLIVHGRRVGLGLRVGLGPGVGVGVGHLHPHLHPHLCICIHAHRLPVHLCSSALFVAAGAASYLTWFMLWHEHEHRHPEGSGAHPPSPLLS